MATLSNTTSTKCKYTTSLLFSVVPAGFFFPRESSSSLMSLIIMPANWRAIVAVWPNLPFYSTAGHFLPETSEVRRSVENEIPRSQDVTAGSGEDTKSTFLNECPAFPRACWTR